MADPTVPWGIPLFDDNTPFAPIQAPFNAQSEALNDALSDGAFAPYTTKALLDAAPGTRVGQHATVYADGTVAYNGDHRWNGTAWAQTWSPSDTVFDLSPISYGGLYRNASGSAPVVVARLNGRCTLEGVITSSSAAFTGGTTYTAGTIVADFRPAFDVQMVVRQGPATANVTISAGGSVYFSLSSGGSFADGQLALSLAGVSWRDKRQ